MRSEINPQTVPFPNNSSTPSGRIRVILFPATQQKVREKLSFAAKSPAHYIFMIDISPFRACHIIIKKKKHEKLYLRGWDGFHRFEYGARALLPYGLRWILVYREDQPLLLDVIKIRLSEHSGPCRSGKDRASTVV